MLSFDWNQPQKLVTRRFVCGYCGLSVASEFGWTASRYERHGPSGSHVVRGAIYICHSCSRPTFFDGDTDRQIPGCAFGKPVENIGDKLLLQIYEEARRATSAGCFTTAVLGCRKLLMHLAVVKGAKEGQSFKSYVEFLANNNHVPADCKPWVEQIREIGNEANHEIKMMSRGDAENLVSFCEMLLKIFYEFPAAAKARSGTKAVPVTA